MKTTSADDKPQLEGPEVFYYQAFRTLSRSRQYSQVGQPFAIPLSEITAYCELFRIHGLDERERLLFFVHQMDDAYIEVRSKQVKDELDRERRKH